jgi:hypothetical protein
VLLGILYRVSVEVNDSEVVQESREGEEEEFLCEKISANPIVPVRT